MLVNNVFHFLSNIPIALITKFFKMCNQLLLALLLKAAFCPELKCAIPELKKKLSVKC